MVQARRFKGLIMKTAFTNFVINRAGLIIICFVLLCATAAYYATQFKINASADTLLTKNNELFVKSQVVSQTFDTQEFILLAYQPTKFDVFSEQTFNDLQSLTDQINQLERVTSINSILNVPLIESSGNYMSGNIADLTYTQQNYSLPAMQQMLKDHPIYTDLLINKDQSAVAIQIVFKTNEELKRLQEEILDIQKITLDRELNSDELEQLETLESQAEPLVTEMEKTRQQEIDKINQARSEYANQANTYLGGSYVVGQHLIEIVRGDLITFGSLIFTLIAIILLIAFRRIHWVLFPMLACSVSVLLSIGTFGFLNMQTTVISANFIALQLILTLAVMLHLIFCFRQVSRDNTSGSQKERVKLMLNEKLMPCFYAALTTSVGFASLIFSGIQPVIDFGTMMLLATLYTMAVSLILFPAILSKFTSKKESEELGLLVWMTDMFRKAVLNSPKSISFCIVIFAIVMTVGISRLSVENSFIHYFAKDTTVYQELKFIDQEFGGSTPLDVTLEVDESLQIKDLVLSADNVNRLHLAHKVSDSFEATGNVTSLINFTTLGRQLNNDKPLTEYELDAVFEMLDKQVANQLIGSYFNEDAEQLRVSIRVQDTTEGLNRASFLNNFRNDLQSTGLDPDSYQLTGLFVLYQDILSRLFDSQIKTLGIVFVALTLVMWLVFKSLKIAVIAIIPNIMVTGILLGGIGWIGLPLDLMTITIAAIAMGIAVDDTIHFVKAYLSSKTDETLKYPFSHTGLAILLTSLVISLGFSMFGLSDFLPSAYFGMLTAASMVLAMLIDMLLLPVLLKRFATRAA